ncbi:MAG: acetolactate decarboxylase [Myxococcales bacterium]|nr:acetolactate decarboxylase [Myxococcales bacterium]MDH3485892.1 acetolactate decarboxylase [Myxococcales bacterium]
MNVWLNIALLCATSVVSCATATMPRDTLYQVSVVNALPAKDYKGQVTLEELLRHGNFGLGTFGRLDGEMIVLNGRIYQAKEDGTVERPPLTETTPWAVITRFRTDSQLSIDHRMTIEELQAKIDADLDNLNIFYALRLQTRIAMITVRSVDAETIVRRSPVSVAGAQKSRTHEDIKGTLVGLRSPSYIGSMNVTGYHWHFISADREVGGHVVAAEVDRGAVDVDHIRTWEVVLPEGNDFGTLDLGTDRTKDLETVEEQPAPVP